MQNHDFAKFDNGGHRNNQQTPSAGRSQRRLMPNADFYGNRNIPSGEKKSKFSMIYLFIVFTLIGFSAGIISGLFISKNSQGVSQIINNIPNKGNETQENKQEKIKVFNDTNQVDIQDTEKKMEDIPEISSKQYLIFTGKYRDVVAYKLGLNLKKQHFQAFLVKSKNGTKIFVGSYSELETAQQDLKKIKEISPEYFGNAVIKVHLSDKTSEDQS